MPERLDIAALVVMALAHKKVFVVTCSTLAEEGEKLDAVFEGSMKTFRFDKK